MTDGPSACAREDELAKKKRRKKKSITQGDIDDMVDDCIDRVTHEIFELAVNLREAYESKD